MTSTRERVPRMTSPPLVLCVALLCCGGPPNPAAPAAVASVPAPSAAPPAPPQPPPFASAVPSSAPAPATPNPQGAEVAEGDEHRRHHHGGVLMLITASIKDLDLGPEQRATVDRIRADLVAKMEPARAAGKDLEMTLADGVAAGAIDAKKADAQVKKLVVQVQGIHDASAAAMNQLHAALTAPQRAALVDSLQSHWEKWKEAHGRDEQDDPQHRSGFLLSLVARLGLTKDQAEKIKATFKEHLKAGPQEHAHKEVQDHLQAFATAFKADTFDAKKLTLAKAANGHMAQWGATRRVRFLEAAAPVLTPDQRTKLAGVIREHANGSEP